MLVVFVMNELLVHSVCLDTLRTKPTDSEKQLERKKAEWAYLRESN